MIRLIVALWRRWNERCPRCASVLFFPAEGVEVCGEECGYRRAR